MIEKDKSLKPPPGRPKDPQKKRVILEAAGQLFRENGFQATSMDAVALSAGVSKQTLYSHFGSKDELFRLVIKGKVDHYEFDSLSELLSYDLATDLNKFGRIFLGLVLDKEAVDMMRVVIGESRKYPKISELFYQMGPDRVTKVLADYLQDQQQRGALLGEDAYHQAVLFLNMLKGDWHLQALMGMHPQITASTLERQVETTVRQFLLLFEPEVNSS